MSWFIEANVDTIEKVQKLKECLCSSGFGFHIKDFKAYFFVNKESIAHKRIQDFMDENKISHSINYGETKVFKSETELIKSV